MQSNLEKECTLAMARTYNKQTSSAAQLNITQHVHVFSLQTLVCVHTLHGNDAMYVCMYVYIHTYIISYIIHIRIYICIYMYVYNIT